MLACHVELRNDGIVPRLFRATLHKRCLILKLGLRVETLQAPCLPPSLVQGRGCWEGVGKGSKCGFGLSDGSSDSRASRACRF